MVALRRGWPAQPRARCEAWPGWARAGHSEKDEVEAALGRGKGGIVPSQSTGRGGGGDPAPPPPGRCDGRVLPSCRRRALPPDRALAVARGHEGGDPGLAASGPAVAGNGEGFAHPSSPVAATLASLKPAARLPPRPVHYGIVWLTPSSPMAATMSTSASIAARLPSSPSLAAPPPAPATRSRFDWLGVPRPRQRTPTASAPSY